MKRLSLAALLGCVAACSLDLGVPANIEITCTTNGECPKGSICDTNVGRCVATETPSLRVDVPDELATRYTRTVPFSVQMVSADAGTPFDVQLEFRLLDEETWRPLTLTADSLPPTGLVGSPSGTTHAFVWDALADATIANGLSVSRVDLDADGQVADPIVRAAEVIIRAVARNSEGSVRSVPAESAPFGIGNVAPTATILDAIGESGVINVIVGLTDSSADVCGFELQFRGPDGVWRNAALAYGSTANLGCLATAPLNASVGWSSAAPYYEASEQPPSTPQGIGDTTLPSPGESARVTLRARAYDSAEAAGVEQHWGIWSPPRVLGRVVNQTSPVVVSASAPRANVAGGTGPLHIRYRVVDAERDLVDASFEFSNDAGTTWQRCEEYAFAMSEGTTGLLTAPFGTNDAGGVEHLFTWDASRGNAKIAASTLLRITVDDGKSSSTVTTIGLGSPATASGDAPHDAFAHAWLTVNLLRSNLTQAGRSQDVAIADFDNDGDKDLVFAKEEVVAGNSLSVFENRGDDPWPAQTHIAGAVRHVVAGNFLNNPARQSLVGSTPSGAATVWAGNGSLGFAVDTSFTIGGTPYDLVAQDLDNDGDADLVVARDDGGGYSVRVFMNSGTPGTRFSSTPSYIASYTFPLSIAVGDLDRDGIADIAVVTQDRDGHVLAGNGAGQFTEIATFDGENGNTDEDSLGMGDVNGDGFADLINVDSSGLILLLTSGGPGALALERLEVGPFGNSLGSASFADLNGDGLTDVVTEGSGGNGIQALLTVLDSITGEISARFTIFPVIDFGLRADDLDNDGVAEIVVHSGNSVGQMTVVRVDGPSTVGGQLFEAGGAIAPTTAVGFPVVANFDDDGVPDLAFVGTTIRVHRGVGAAGVGDGFYRAEEETTGVDSNDILINTDAFEAKAADVNGDGVDDVVMLAVQRFIDPPAHFEVLLAWVTSRPLQGVADARFNPAGHMLISGTGYTDQTTLQVADFDRDGRLDVAYLYQDDFGSPDWSLGVAFNKGAALFTQQDATYLVGQFVTDLEVGYIGADALPDLIVTMRSDDLIGIYNNATTPVNRANPFTVSTLPTGGASQGGRLSDLNWDGVTDIWMRQSTSIRMRNGIAAGGFSPPDDYLPSTFISNAYYFDATLDGVNDFVFLGFPSSQTGGVAAGFTTLDVPANDFAPPASFAGEDIFEDVPTWPSDPNCDGMIDLAVSVGNNASLVLARGRDMAGPQLSLVAPPRDVAKPRKLASLGMSAPYPQHPWHVVGGAPCAAKPRWEDDLREWRVRHGDGSRFRVLSPARWLGETSRYIKTQVGDDIRFLRTSRFSPPLSLATDGAPRGFVATLTVERGRRASVVPAKLRVYRQSEALLTAAELPGDSLSAHPDAARMLPQMPTSQGLSDVVRRRWTWELVPLDGDSNLTTGTGRRYVYNAASGRIDILTDEGGLYAVVEEP